MISQKIKFSIYGHALVDEDTDQTAYTKLLSLYNIRHDLFLELANYCLRNIVSYSVEEVLSTNFEQEIPSDIANLTPDIFFFKQDKFHILDVSVTKDWNKHNTQKKAKYDPIVSFVRSQGLECCEFKMIWQDSAEETIDSFLMSIQNYCHLNEITYYSPNKKYKSDVVQIYTGMNDFIRQLSVKCSDLIKAELDFIPDPENHRSIYGNMSYSKKTSFIIEKLESNTLSAEDYFNELVNDRQIYNKLLDKKHDSSMYERSFGHVRQMEHDFPKGKVAPTIFIPYAEFQDKDLLNEILPVNPHKMPLEQDCCYKLLKYIVSQIEDNSKPFFVHLLNQMDLCFESQNELNIFNTGCFTKDIDHEKKLNELYKDYRMKVDTSMSKRTFFQQNLKESDFRTSLPMVFRNKSIRVAPYSRTDAFLKKSGTAYRKSHELREYKEKTTLPKDYTGEMKSFMNLLEEKTSNIHKVSDFLGSDPGCDSPSITSVKNMLIKNHRNFLNLVQPTKCHSFLKHTSLTAAQLLHFTEMNTNENVYQVMCSGMPNLIHIVRGGSLQRGNDVGQAFFSVFLTDDERWSSEIYGNLNVTVIDRKRNIFLVRTPWVRLSSERLCFMKDQYASVISTAYDTWARSKSRALEQGFMTHMLTFRAIVASCPSQKVAELLMDTRYIFMSALSYYSNVEQLITEKFSPPYKNILEQFIVHNLGHKCKRVVQHFLKNPPKINTPTFDGNKRLHHSLGGRITVPSLWSSVILNDLQSVFDDLFVYVHTSKEASSEYHEQIKAINTILKFQTEFDKLTFEQQNGFFSVNEFKEHILSGKTVACSSIVIEHSSKIFSKKCSFLKDLPSFKNNCLKEPLGNLTSTKSCIPEIPREIQSVEHSKKKYNQIVKNIASINSQTGAGYDITSVLKEYKALAPQNNFENIVISKQGRAKVHDCLLEWVSREYKSRPNYVIDLAYWNIFMNSQRVIADICIKAQYGAKREFYVINLGAKAMARVVENGYKELAKLTKSEMISVPGDQKLKYIQDSINSSILQSQRKQDTLLYVNGDCTKWSACETMASFISMSKGLSSCFGEEFTEIALSTFDSWSNKKIQIPSVILRSLRFFSEKTSYIDDDCILTSTQNFLQGMFNYSSSMKAVIATEFAIHMFKKNYPNSYLSCNHLEHSDDYSLVVRCKDLNEFEIFRVYHKLSQKLHGINDSEKKTNVQPHILEFISLFSFNGQLYYPNIKKTKEVGTNLSCEDFKSDVMSISSRVAEAVRIGVSQESCYFMQRAHCMTIAAAYSLEPGMRNGFRSSTQSFNTPLELFGFPDCLPICSQIVKGSPENYRLYNFGTSDIKNVLEKLYVLNKTLMSDLDFGVAGFKSEISDFYTPRFSYRLKQNRLKKIRDQIGFGYLQAYEYFEQNITDTLVKPIDTSRLITWMKSMYFNRSFCKAYTSISRASMCLRHSNYSSKPCILSPFSTKDNVTFLTIIDYIELINKVNLKMDFDEVLFNKSLSCFSSNLELIYKLTESSKLIELTEIEAIKTTVNRIPESFRWINLENNASSVIQSMIDPLNYKNDRKFFLSDTSLKRDIKKLEALFDMDLAKKSRTYLRQVFKEIQLQTSSKTFGLTYVSDVSDLTKYMKQSFDLGMLYNKQFRMIPCERTEIKNPMTGKLMYSMDWKTNQSLHTAILSQSALIYRLIVLTSQEGLEELNSKLEIFLESKITALGIKFGDFLTQQNMESLEMLQCGENAKKVLSFLKYRLLGDLSDLKKFVESKFFYEVSYKQNMNVPGFEERATIKFLGTQYNAYLKEVLGKKTVYLETRNVNKTFLFYAYSMAQRAFGLISQVELDARLMECKDFKIPIMSNEHTDCLNVLRLSNREQIYFKMVGKVMKETRDLSEANMPIIVQNHRHSFETGKKQQLHNYGRINCTDFSVRVGNAPLFKLPFGNLMYSENNFEFIENEIIIENVSINTILKSRGLLNAYLKCDKSFVMREYLNEELIRTLGDNISKNIDETFKKYFKQEVDFVPEYKDFVSMKIEENEKLNIITVPDSDEMLIKTGKDVFTPKPVDVFSNVGISSDGRETPPEDNPTFVLEQTIEDQINIINMGQVGVVRQVKNKETLQAIEKLKVEIEEYTQLANSLRDGTLEKLDIEEVLDELKYDLACLSEGAEETQEFSEQKEELEITPKKLDIISIQKEEDQQILNNDYFIGKSMELTNECHKSLDMVIESVTQLNMEMELEVDFYKKLILEETMETFLEDFENLNAEIEKMEEMVKKIKEREEEEDKQILDNDYFLEKSKELNYECQKSLDMIIESVTQLNIELELEFDFSKKMILEETMETFLEEFENLNAEIEKMEELIKKIKDKGKGEETSLKNINREEISENERLLKERLKVLEDDRLEVLRELNEIEGFIEKSDMDDEDLELNEIKRKMVLTLNAIENHIRQANFEMDELKNIASAKQTEAQQDRFEYEEGMFDFEEGINLLSQEELTFGFDFDKINLTDADVLKTNEESVEGEVDTISIPKEDVEEPAEIATAFGTQFEDPSMLDFGLDFRMATNTVEVDTTLAENEDFYELNFQTDFSKVDLFVRQEKEEQLDWKERILQVEDDERRNLIFFDDMDNMWEHDLLDYLEVDDLGSSDSSSDLSEEKVYIQWSNNKSTQNYNFDVRMREEMGSLTGFILDVNYRLDFQNMFNSSENVKSVLRMLYSFRNYTHSQKKPTKENNLRKCACNIVLYFFEKHFSKTYSLISLTPRKAFRMVDNKIVFMAVKGFEEAGEAYNFASTRNNVQATEMMYFNASSGLEKAWAYTELKNKDIQDLLVGDYDLDFKMSDSILSSILNSIKFINIRQVEELQEDYF